MQLLLTVGGGARRMDNESILIVGFFGLIVSELKQQCSFKRKTLHISRNFICWTKDLRIFVGYVNDINSKSQFWSQIIEGKF